MSDALAPFPNAVSRASAFHPAVTVDAFLKLVEFLYGVSPEVDEALVKPLLAVAGYFGVPQLSLLVSDFAFSSMSLSNCTLYASMGHLELGEPGRLIAAAAMAFLHRNAVDLGDRLCELSVPLQTQVLASPDLYVPSEFHRYQLVLKVKRACLARVASSRPLPAAMEPPGFSWTDAAAPAPLLAGADAMQVSWGDMSWSSAEDEKGRGGGPGGDTRVHERFDGSRVPGHWKRTSPGPLRPHAPSELLGGGQRGLSGPDTYAPLPAPSVAPAASSSFSAACSASSVQAAPGGSSVASLPCQDHSHFPIARADIVAVPPAVGAAPAVMPAALSAREADTDTSCGDDTCVSTVRQA